MSLLAIDIINQLGFLVPWVITVLIFAVMLFLVPMILLRSGMEEKLYLSSGMVGGMSKRDIFYVTLQVLRLDLVTSCAVLMEFKPVHLVLMVTLSLAIILIRWRGTAVILEVVGVIIMSGSLLMANMLSNFVGIAGQDSNLLTTFAVVLSVAVFMTCSAIALVDIKWLLDEIKNSHAPGKIAAFEERRKVQEEKRIQQEAQQREMKRKATERKKTRRESRRVRLGDTKRTKGSLLDIALSAKEVSE